VDNYQGKQFWIIGATSGIGRALAVSLCNRGARVIASGRTEDALKSLAIECSHLSGEIIPLPIDLAEDNALPSALASIQTQNPLPDSVVYLAAYYQPGPISDITKDNLSQSLSINLRAAIELVQTILPSFLERGHGQIAITASVAGFCGLPNGQPYSATKAALINFVESLNTEVKAKGIDVRLINPGFVDTPMTKKNSFDMPEVITAELAGEEIAEALGKTGFEIHFPKKFTRKMKILRALPYSLYFKLIKRL